MQMKLVSVTTAIDYADYLASTIVSLVGSVDVCYVVTQSNDAAIEVASRNGAVPVLFDGWRSDGALINKSGAVRFGQSFAYQQHPDAWYLLADADIVVPPDCRAVIENHAQDEQAMYGARRVDFHTPEDVQNGTPTKPYGAAWAGYFQLYKQHVFYPEWSRSCEGSDLAFASRFDACRMLPMTVAHIGKECTNWEGRKSPAWISASLKLK